MIFLVVICFFKQKTAYEMRISDWSSDVCSSDLSSIAWLPDAESFYYVRRLPPERVPKGEEQFHRRVHLHGMGSDPDQDEEIFEIGRAPCRERVWQYV